jgi:hypothetical protein
MRTMMKRPVGYSSLGHLVGWLVAIAIFASFFIYLSSVLPFD